MPQVGASCDGHHHCDSESEFCAISDIRTKMGAKASAQVGAKSYDTSHACATPKPYDHNKIG